MKRPLLLAALAPLAFLALPTFSHAQLGALEPPGAGIIKGPRNGPGEPAAKGAPGENKPGATKPKKAMEIISRDALFNMKINEVIFVGEVDVKDPELHLVCDKLTVYLKPKNPKDEAVAPAEAPPIGAEPGTVPKKPKEAKPAAAAAGEGDGDGGGGVDRAIAEGNVVIDLVQVDANGKKTVYHATAGRAVFDNKKNTCVLTIWPNLTVGGDKEEPKSVLARFAEAVITLNRADETLNTSGTRTVISGASLNETKKKPGSR